MTIFYVLFLKKMEEGSDINKNFNAVLQRATPVQLRAFAAIMINAANDREAIDPLFRRVSRLPPGRSYAETRQFIINVLRPIKAKNVNAKNNSSEAEIRFYNGEDAVRGADILRAAGFECK
ncbi:MAG: hypothetical protein K2Q45_01490 [Nitrosomonas sp.]|nr:hypothetical protein [Nitrosomonas sp.]